MIDLQEALWWLFLNLISTFILAFYSMEEMACVSFNRIRLHYYVAKGNKRAQWLNYLLDNPSRLFGTTLFSVNAAMFIGSECSRQMFISLGISPDFAPIIQVPIVIVFAELAPMFAARRYAEHVALLGAPILYGSARLMTPILWMIDLIAKGVDTLIGGKKQDRNVLNQEDLQKILAQDEDRGSESESDDFHAISSNLFSLRHKEARQIMQPIDTVSALSSNASVEQVRKLLTKSRTAYIPIYHRDIAHIVGIAHPRDLARAPDSRRIRDYTTPPWFITQNTKLMQILKEFRRNKRTVAVVLNHQGLAVGIITLSDLAEEIFGKVGEDFSEPIKSEPAFIIDRTFPGEMTVHEFNSQFDVVLDEDEELTLAELMAKILGHPPEQNESVYIAPFELTVVESTLMEAKRISVETRLV